jgi:hypothetical protein
MAPLGWSLAREPTRWQRQRAQDDITFEGKLTLISVTGLERKVET